MLIPMLMQGDARQAGPRRHLRNGLSDARWHGDPRLHPRRRPRGRARASARSRRMERPDLGFTGAEPRDRHRVVGEAGDRARRGGRERPRGPLRWSPTTAGRPPQVWADPSLARTTLGWAGAPRPAGDGQHGVGLALPPRAPRTIASTRARRRRRGVATSSAMTRRWRAGQRSPAARKTRSFAAALPSGRRAAATRSAGGSCR